MWPRRRGDRLTTVESESDLALLASSAEVDPVMVIVGPLAPGGVTVTLGGVGTAGEVVLGGASVTALALSSGAAEAVVIKPQPIAAAPANSSARDSVANPPNRLSCGCMGSCISFSVKRGCLVLR